MNEQQTIDDLLSRGVENIISNKTALNELLNSGKTLNCYLGIDPTATQIHLGHAFSLRKLQQMVDLGHNVTFLIGNYTALIGDTSDKNEERPMLSQDQIEANFKEYKRQAAKFLDFSKVNLAYNGDWLSKLTFKDLLEIASNFSVNDFTSRELIRKRLDAGKRVSLPETLYPLMQGYDSYHLDTDIQFGGTDQTFNMQAGRTLNKRLRKKDSFIIATGFLPGTDGRKMSKSWGNAIWLEDEPNEVFGKVMRISDDVVADYFVYGTNISLEDIEHYKSTHKDNPMELKKVLARQIVSELHSELALKSAEKHFVDTVQNKQADGSAIEYRVDTAELNSSMIIDALVETKLAKSKSDARRLYSQNSIRLDDKQLTLDDTVSVSNEAVIRIGKRRYIRFINS